MTQAKAKYWTGHIGERDDFEQPIKDIFVDGKTKQGQWAIMSPASWRMYGVGTYGTGFGQRYAKTASGKWLKIEG